MQSGIRNYNEAGDARRIDPSRSDPGSSNVAKKKSAKKAIRKSAAKPAAPAKRAPAAKAAAQPVAVPSVVVFFELRDVAGVRFHGEYVDIERARIAARALVSSPDVAQAWILRDLEIVRKPGL
jgi:hypothetical protein